MSMEPLEVAGVKVNTNARRTPGQLLSSTLFRFCLVDGGLLVSYSFSNNNNCASNCVKVFHFLEEKGQVTIHPQPHPF